MGVKLNQKLWRAVNNPFFFKVDQLNLDQNSHDKKRWYKNMIDKDSYGLKKERNVLQEPHNEKENNSKNSDDKYQ